MSVNLKKGLAYLSLNAVSLVAILTIWAVLMNNSIIRSEWFYWRAGLLVVIGQMILFSLFIKEFNKPLFGAALAFAPIVLWIIYFGFKSYLYWHMCADAVSNLHMPFIGGIGVSVVVGLFIISDE